MRNDQDDIARAIGCDLAGIRRDLLQFEIAHAKAKLFAPIIARAVKALAGMAGALRKTRGAGDRAFLAGELARAVRETRRMVRRAVEYPRKAGHLRTLDRHAARAAKCTKRPRKK